MKRFLLLTIIFSLVLFSFVACTPEKTQETKGSKMIAVNVPDITEYVLVRSDQASKEVREAAAALKVRLEQMTGTTFKLVTDFGAKNEKEILIGETNRSESKSVQASLGTYSSFGIQKKGNKIVICGKNDYSTVNATKFWLDYMVKEHHICVPEMGELYVYKPKVQYEKISVGDFDLSDYSVLYLDRGLESEANKISDLIFEYSDIRLPIVDIELNDNKYITLKLSPDIFKSSMTVDGEKVTIEYAHSDITYGSDIMGCILKEGRQTLNLTSKYNNLLSHDKMGSYTKEDLIKLLENIHASDNVIIGQQSNINGDSSAIASTLNSFKNATGEDLAMIGLDIRMSNLVKLGDSGCRKVLWDLVDFASKGGIITASAHFSNPNDGDPESENYRGILGDDNAWKELVTKGTALNESFTRELSEIADFLNVLDECDVPVIWRPLHEANGNWFWFCMVQKLDNGSYKVSEDAFKNLWKYIYNYMTVERGLSNLIWEFSPNIGSESDTMVAPLYGYPGDEYVDLVGFDWYTIGNYSQIDTAPTYKDLESTGKILSITEFGPSGSILAENIADQPNLFSCKDMLTYLENIKKDGKHIVYILTWTDGWSIEAMGDGDVLMLNDLTLSLKDVSKMFNELKN